MGRRRFDYFYIELCCALGRRVGRMALWLTLRERGLDPDHLDRDAQLRFFDAHLDGFLAACGGTLEPRARRKLRRSIMRYRPEFATPYEIVERLAAPSSS